MCEIFQIFLSFKEVTIKNINSDVESQEVTLSLDVLGNKLECENQDSIILIDGCHSIRNNFIMRSACPIDNEDYSFTVFGSSVTTQLHLTKIIEKSKKKSEKIDVLFAEGSINLLQNFKEFQRDSKYLNNIVELKVINQGETEIILAYDISFENVPNFDSTLSLNITSIHNFELPENSMYEACFRFPFNKSFRAVLMHKVVANECKAEENYHLMDDLLKEKNFEINENSCENSSSINLFYENFLTASGLNLYHELIKNNQKLLVELKFNDIMYMTFIDLTIFNHADVNSMNFLIPLYEWNNKLILNQFQQDSCFTVNESVKVKRRSKKSIDKSSIEIEENLKPIEINGNYAALEISLKISEPLHSEKPLDFMIQELDQKFPFMVKVNEQSMAVQESQNYLRCVVHQIAGIFEEVIGNNLKLKDDEIMQKIKDFVDSPNFCHKIEFKEAVEAVIGNTFNQEFKTETNHDFKLLLMKAFKSLSSMVDKIVIDRHKKKHEKGKVFLDENVKKWQIEEYIEYGNYEKSELLIERELDESLDEIKLKEMAIYLLKLKEYDKLEITLMQLLKIYKYCTFSLHILSYIFFIKNDFGAAILILTILTNIRPDSMEYWIILSNIYGKVGNEPGMKYCDVKIQGSKFISNFKLNDSLMHPEVISIDPLINIQWNQYKFSMPEFHQMTLEYISTNRPEIANQLESLMLKIIKLTDEKKYQEALNILREITMDDENEVTLRTLKGNSLFSIDKWKAICEYEIAFNLCQKFNLKFPLIPLLRCGSWYLNEMENLPKARKYYKFCSKNFGTFQSLMGLGKVYIKSNDFLEAEKCLMDGNLIDPNSNEIWLFLSLVYSKLKKQNSALKCYLTAKKLGVENCKELIEIEEYLDI